MVFIDFIQRNVVQLLIQGHVSANNDNKIRVQFSKFLCSISQRDMPFNLPNVYDSFAKDGYLSFRNVQSSSDFAWK